MSPAWKGWVSCGFGIRAPEARHSRATECYDAPPSEAQKREPFLHQQPRSCGLQHHNRKDLIPPAFEKRLYSFIAEIGREHKIPLLAAGGMPNHSHLLFLLPATMTLAKAVNTFTANSSRFLGKQRIPFNWQEGYGAFAVSASQIDTVIAYIRNQREHHKKRSFEQEFLAMLKKARIPLIQNMCLGECRASGARNSTFI